jgi:hypothetical protein
MTLTRNRTSSTASAGSNSSFPSEYRYSIAKSRPSTYPRSRRPCLNASIRRASSPGKRVNDRTPILHTFPACCAPAASGAARTPASEVSRKRRRSMTGASIKLGHQGQVDSGVDRRNPAAERHAACAGDLDQTVWGHVSDDRFQSPVRPVVSDKFLKVAEHHQSALSHGCNGVGCKTGSPLGW